MSSARAGESRSTPPVLGILMDVEGTTTALSFVLDVLFPYAAARLDATCARAAGPDPDPELAAALARLREEHAAERAREPALPPFGDGASYARHLMAQDRKSTGLKALQGLIWEEGYASGELRGHLFPDVPPALAAWREAGVPLRVFSSGSVRAQRLLFGHTDHGDLTPLFAGFHDTTTGGKLEPASYRKIAAAFDLPPEGILFLSDTVGELDAAAAAGLRTGRLDRPGNRPQPPSGHPVYASFAEIA
jgi:enolase-phosphatase E1